MRKNRNRTYTKEEIRMVNKYTKRCSSLPVFGDLQIKKHFTWAKIKKSANVIDVGKWFSQNCKWEHNFVQELSRAICQDLLTFKCASPVTQQFHFSQPPWRNTESTKRHVQGCSLERCWQQQKPQMSQMYISWGLSEQTAVCGRIMKCYAVHKL